MYPWFKFFFRRFLDAPYYWFYVNNRRLGFRILFNDFKLIYYGIINNFLDLNLIKNFNHTSFFTEDCQILIIIMKFLENTF